MEFAFIPDRVAREELATGVDDVISAVEKEVSMRAERDEIEALIRSVEREQPTSQRLGEQVESLLDQASEYRMPRRAARDPRGRVDEVSARRARRREVRRTVRRSPGQAGEVA